MSDLILRKCSKCAEEKPVSHYNIEKGRKDGLRPYCKVCQSVMKKKWHEQNKDSEREKALSRYYADPEKGKADNTAWRKANPEKRKALNRASWWRHREERIRRTVEDQRKNREGHLARCQAYNDRKRNADGKLTKDEFRDIVSKQEGLCFYCEKPMKTPVSEHVTPLSRGGVNWFSNIVASCASCNASKGTRNLEEFRPDLIEKFKSHKEVL